MIQAYNIPLANIVRYGFLSHSISSNLSQDFLSLTHLTGAYTELNNAKTNIISNRYKLHFKREGNTCQIGSVGAHVSQAALRKEPHRCFADPGTPWTDNRALPNRFCRQVKRHRAPLCHMPSFSRASPSAPIWAQLPLWPPLAAPVLFP